MTDSNSSKTAELSKMHRKFFENKHDVAVVFFFVFGILGLFIFTPIIPILSFLMIPVACYLSNLENPPN